MLVKVNDSSFVRDTDSMGLSNINKHERDEYYNKIRALKIQKDEVNALKEEIDNLKSDISEIKQLLYKLIG